MFRKVPLADVDLATPADGPPAAHGVNINAQRPRGGQHRRASGKPPALAGRGENDEGILLSHASFIAEGRLLHRPNCDNLE